MRVAHILSWNYMEFQGQTAKHSIHRLAGWFKAFIPHPEVDVDPFHNSSCSSVAKPDHHRIYSIYPSSVPVSLDILDLGKRPNIGQAGIGTVKS